MNPQTPSTPTGARRSVTEPAEGHSDLVGQAHVGQPHEDVAEGPVAQAEAVAAAINTDEQPIGTVGRRFDRKAPFYIGMTATAGVAVTYGLIQLLLLAGNVLILIGLALFLAVGMGPAVSFLVKHRWPRWLGVTAILLSIMVALFDLVPVVGSSIAGIIVAAAALTISFPMCLATIAFFVINRTAEDYFLVPRVIGRAVKVPALFTVVAVLIGGTLLGIIGALVAIPVAAVLLITRETLFPRLDQA